MKRIFYFFVAAVLCAAACQKVDQIDQVGEKVEVAFNVALPGSIGTKSISDGEKALTLYYATYTDAGKLIESLSNTQEGVAISGKTATITLQLVKDLNYDVVFWAQADECTAYTFDWTAATMTVNYAGVANDDHRDAFYAVRQDLKVPSGLHQETVTLYRPFAQINFGAADYDSVVEYYDQVSVDAGMESALVCAEVPNTLDLLEETLGTTYAAADFTLAPIPNDPRLLEVNNAGYKYVAMNYILAPKGAEPAMLPSITANFQYTDGNINRSVEVKNVPYLRNHRTNIIGNFFTETAILSVVVDENFDKPDFNIIDPGVEFTQKKLDSLARIAGTSIYVPAGNPAWNLPAEIAEGVEFIGAPNAILNAGASAQPFTVGGNASVVLDNTVLSAAEGSAITISENADVKITVVGEAKVKAAADAIFVPASSTLTLSGNNLVVKGGSEEDTVNGGSAIGGAGIINIDGLLYLTAEGYGVNGYGIGGAEATVYVKNSTVSYARGGYPQDLCVNDPKYGKSEPEGAPAIGGAVIVIDNSTVIKAEGGSKAAAIGARYWQNTDITISKSTITEALGGNASAGIGGSRYSDDISAENMQTVKILISDSDVTATGGQFGAGIGAGYDTHCKANATNSVNDIQIVNSTVNATGGQYASGIGSGYHSAALTGSIDAASVVTAISGEKFYKATYTQAQNIGYGVIDPAREGADLDVTFTVAGTLIENPIENNN
ncbi:MAG: DUF6562 domain-containing protein [Bacteroidales bacterium]|nr:DUF6562 domain-containing protein [Bacteroidales bacterium]